MVGWWKFHRRMTEHAVWSLNSDHRVIWLTILSLASHRDAEWWDGKQRVQLHPGDLVTSQESLALKSHTSRQSVRAAISNLLRLESISTKIATKQYTVITVINWPIYQGEENEANQEANHLPTQSQPSANHIGRMKEGKKEKREEKDIVGFDLFWATYPNKKAKGTAKVSFVKAMEKVSLEKMIAAVEAQTSWAAWTKDGGAYIPHPATWLNQERWNDEAPVVQAQINPKTAGTVAAMKEFLDAGKRQGEILVNPDGPGHHVLPRTGSSDVRDLLPRPR